MKFNNFWAGAITALIFCTVADFICHQYYIRTDIGEPTIEVRADTITKYIYTPIPIDSAFIRYVTIKVPVPGETIIRTDTVHVADSVPVRLPITQVQYHDSTYQAWVSGYQPALDSIRIFQPITTITKTIPEIRYKANKWGVGVQVGLGVTPTKIEPYIGIGVTYNIFSW